MNWWAYFAIGVVSWPIIKTLALAINRAVIEHRQKKFLKLLKIEYPGKRTITLISVDSSDKRAMAKLERQFHEQYDIDR